MIERIRTRDAADAAESCRTIWDICISSGIAFRRVVSCFVLSANTRAVDERLGRLKLQLGIVDPHRKIGRLRSLRRDEAEPPDKDNDQ